MGGGVKKYTKAHPFRKYGIRGMSLVKMMLIQQGTIPLKKNNSCLVQIVKTLSGNLKNKKEALLKSWVISTISYSLPAQYVTEDIDADGRRRKIHERCGVIKFYCDNPSVNILITGDSDKKAWKEHITDYREDKFSSDVLRSSHHNSRSSFKEGKGDEDIT